ncbi:hypothetical protein [Pseudomonas baetica]|uniref:hypothetical protein n=1 Tax=Pseudomonas baetica TaxID=674054 RepID=UPI001EDEDE06
MRASAGLLITTEPRPERMKHHKDLPAIADASPLRGDQKFDSLPAGQRALARKPVIMDVAMAPYAQHQA